MSADDRAVHKMEAPVHPTLALGQGLERFQHTLPDPGLAPPIEPAGHRPNGAIVARQIIPWSAAAIDPKDAIKNPTVIVVRSACARLFRRQERFQPRPLYIS